MSDAQQAAGIELLKVRALLLIAEILLYDQATVLVAAKEAELRSDLQELLDDTFTAEDENV